MDSFTFVRLMTLQPVLGGGPLPPFQFLSPIQSRQESLNIFLEFKILLGFSTGEPVWNIRLTFKVVQYTGNGTPACALSGNWTHNHTAGASETISCRIQLGHCDRRCKVTWNLRPQFPMNSMLKRASRQWIVPMNSVLKGGSRSLIVPMNFILKNASSQL
jgi:hypothetical protein